MRRATEVPRAWSTSSGPEVDRPITVLLTQSRRLSVRATSMGALLMDSMQTGEIFLHKIQTVQSMSCSVRSRVV
jgi:hypothetical protein